MPNCCFTNANEPNFQIYHERTVKLFKSKSKSDQSTLEYAQNSSIGFSSPAGQFDFEFLIKGKKVPSALNQILSVFLEHYANLLSLSNNNSSNDGRAFKLSLSCNLEHSDIGPLGFCTLLRKLGFVNGVDYSEMDGRLFGKARFPLTFYGSERAVALRSNTLISLGMRLAKETGCVGTSSLFEEGRNYAKDTVEELKEILGEQGERLEEREELPFHSYVISENESEKKIQAYCVKCRQMKEIEKPTEVILKNGRPAMQGLCPACSTKVFKIGSVKLGKILSNPLIDNMQGFLIASGLGTFELRKQAEGRRGTVTILNPPTVKNDGEDDISYGNQFLEGIAAGFLESIFGSINEMRLVGERYVSSKKMLDLHFAEYVPVVTKKTPPKPIEVRKRIKRKIKVKREIQLPQIEQISSLTAPEEYQEVERIIHSLEQIEAQAKESVLDKTMTEGRREEVQVPQEILVEERTSTAKSSE